jgi:hypothetical protein
VKKPSRRRASVRGTMRTMRATSRER